MVSGTPALSQENLSPSLRNWQGWTQFVVLLTAIWLLYHQVAFRLVQQWLADPDYNYGLLVPLLAAGVVWKERAHLKKLTPVPSWTGLLVVLGSLALLVVGVLGAENFLQRTSLIFLLAGLVVQFRGWRYFRALLFPWLTLFLAIPLPALIYNQIGLPLQFLASRLGAALLGLTGLPVQCEGNVIILPAVTLEVAEACSGLRLLLSLVTLSIFYAYFFEKNLRRRILLVACSIPIAILANGLRILGTGVMSHYWGAEWAEGVLHSSTGVLVFAFSFVALALLRRFFDWCGRAAGSKVNV
jgi:exosortase